VGGRIVVVGLGPAGADLVLPAARRALEQSRNRYVRTARHPAVHDLADAGIELRSFDDAYDHAGAVDDVYARIASELLGVAASSGEVVYAVPGNPAVAERSVELLREAADRGDVVLEIVPGLSFAELAWTRLGVDPMNGARVADARRLAAEDVVGGGPLLVAQCDTRLLLSDVKLVLLEVLPADAPVTVLQRLGLDDEEVRTVALAELDRAVEPDHLTALLVSSGVSAAAREVARLLGLAERLRGPGGCPWDADQTHHSLTRYLLEEAYEVVESVEALPPDAPAGEVPPQAYRDLEDELGDLLYQVIFHAVLAQEAGAFDMADVARGIHDKLVRRHPHVFGDADAATSSDVMRNWEQIKKDEKGASSIVAGITPGLPSLLYAHKLLRKAASVGLARSGGIDAESALRGWAVRFRRRFEAMERRAEAERLELAALPADAVAVLWAESGGEP
jgi:tetrapyrrole methylase family protein/MazG family protein